MADSPLTIEHVRTATRVGPDYCPKCSDAAGAWVKFPCAASVAIAERDAARSEVTVMREALETTHRLALQGGYRPGDEDALNATCAALAAVSEHGESNHG